MPVMDQLTSLLITAERASAESPVTLDVFHRGQAAPSSDGSTDTESVQAPLGRIVADAGRICWVAAKGYNTTMSDLLAAATGIPARQLEDVYEVACTEGSPFCETLVATGLVSAEEVHDTLRQQTADAARTLAGNNEDDKNTVCVARIPRLAYDPCFTFGALEVLEAAISGSQELRLGEASVPSRYQQVAARSTAALCFRESDGPELPFVPVAGGSHSGLTLAEAVELALAGLAASQPADAVLAEITPFPLVLNGDSEWWICEHAAPHLCLYQVNARDEYLDVMEALVSGRRAA